LIRRRNMKKKAFEPIDEEEEDLIDSIEQDEWKSADSKDSHKGRAVRFADATMRKDKRMNIRISERDLRNLKTKAMEEGLPYQTLVSMIIHKYLSGHLEERVS
jgi:predicted DNA binding CopG/RHH family protein